MLRYALTRLFFGMVAVIGVTLITFVAARASGDATYLRIPENATEADIERIRADLGLDKSVPEQFVIYVGDVLHGDFGTSIKYGIPATDLITSRIQATVELALAAFVLAVVIGILLGVLAAYKRGTILDTGASLVGLLGQAMPGFWVAIMLILVFSVRLGWFPTSGRGSFSHIVLPAVALSLFSAAALMRLTRSSMLNVLDSEYVKLARLKGVSERVVIWKHALRNALVPVLTYAGLTLATLLGGAVIVESVFAWPGIGSLMVQSITARDYAVVQAGVFLTATMLVLANLVVDLLYGLIDPRIRQGRAS